MITSIENIGLPWYGKAALFVSVTTKKWACEMLTNIYVHVYSFKFTLIFQWMNIFQLWINYEKLCVALLPGNILSI